MITQETKIIEVNPEGIPEFLKALPYVGGGQNSHSKGGEKRPILGKLRTNNSVHFNLLSIRFV